MHTVARRQPPLFLAASCVLTLGLLAAGCTHHDAHVAAPPPAVSLPPPGAVPGRAVVLPPASGGYAPPAQGYQAAPPQNTAYAPPPAQPMAAAPPAQGGGYQPGAGPGYPPVPQGQGQASAPPASSAASSGVRGLTSQELAAKMARETAAQPDHPAYTPPPYKGDPTDYAPH